MTQRLDELEALKATAEELRAKTLTLYLRSKIELEHPSLKERLKDSVRACIQVDRAIEKLEREVA